MKRALWIVTLAIGFTVSANAQTIADIARQERANRKNAPKAAAPITNERAAKAKGSEVSSAPVPAPPAFSPIPTPAAGGTAAAKPADPAQASEPKRDTRDEQWWRNEFDKVRVDIRRAENQAAVAQLELNATNRDYLTRSYDPDGRGPAAISSATAKSEAAQKSVDQARARLAQLEEELRRAGAPPGWGR